MPVINKKLVLKDSLIISVKGDANIKIRESHIDELNISHDDSLDDFEILFGNNSISVTDKTKNNYIPEKLSNSGVLFELLSVINKLKSETNSRKKISIDIGLKNRANFDIFLSCDNLNLEASSVKIGKITVNSANLSLLVSNDFSSTSIEIYSSNIKGDIWHSALTKNISIKANNGKLLVRRNHDYSGAMSFSGNNLKINGNNSLGNPSLGLLKVKMNNGKVHLVEQQGVLEK